MKTLTKTILITFAIAMITSVGSAQASEVLGTISSSGSGSGATVVVSPIASPTAGTYTGAQSVELTATNSDEIRYFFNKPNLDNELTCTNAAPTVYNGPIDVSGSGLIRAIACYSGNSSPIASFTYVIEAASSSGGGGGGNSGGSSGGGGGGGGYIPPTTLPTIAQADFNGDGSIGILDFNILITNWGVITGATKATGDANGDGKVDIFDFNILITNWPS